MNEATLSVSLSEELKEAQAGEGEMEGGREGARDRKTETDSHSLPEWLILW